MAIAGPIASVALGAICLALAHTLGWQMGTNPQAPPAAVLVWLGYINLALAAFNLIPGFPMDGGRVLRAIIWWATGNGETATRIAAGIGQLVGWLFVVWGIFRVFTGAGIGGLWIALIGWFLVQAASATLLQAQAASALRGLKVRDVMTTDCEHVDAALSVQEFVNWRLAHGEGRCFLVYDAERLAGMITLADVRKIERERWPQTTMRQIMQPIEAVPTVPPDTPVQEAMEKMMRDDREVLVVAEQGTMVGVVSRAHILRLLQVRSELRAA
jgi:CBS domain-containing protein